MWYGATIHILEERWRVAVIITIWCVVWASCSVYIYSWFGNKFNLTAQIHRKNLLDDDKKYWEHIVLSSFVQMHLCVNLRRKWMRNLYRVIFNCNEIPQTLRAWIECCKKIYRLCYGCISQHFSSPVIFFQNEMRFLINNK